MFANIWTASEANVIVDILVLVDISLVASLLLIIIFSGYEIFVSKSTSVIMLIGLAGWVRSIFLVSN